MVAKIATGEIEEDFGPDDGKDPNAKALGKKGGAARAASMTLERRAGITQRLWSMEDIAALAPED